MKLKQLALIVTVVFVLSSFAFTEDPTKPPVPILKPGDVKQFIKTFPLLDKDFKNFGARYEAQSGDLTVPEALKANEKFLGILKKHGWDEHFFQKAGVIFMGYSAVVYGKEIKKAGPQIEKSLKEMESNPHLSEAMKEQMKAQIKAARGVLAGQNSIFKNKIHKKDLDLVRPFVEELKKVVEETKDN